MISNEHKKHSDLAKPSTGAFCRNEWAITGTGCSVIQSLAGVIIERLSPLWECAYADKQHAHVDDEDFSGEELYAHAAISFVDNDISHPFRYNQPPNPLHLKTMFSGMDMMLVNGNHLEAKAQVIVVDPAKKDLLIKRLPLLTNVQLILLTGTSTDVFECIKDAIPYWHMLPVYHLNETGNIISFFSMKLREAQPVLKGLVLAGGKSVRMGYDKTQTEWHGKQQRYYMADLLKECCSDVYISCRPGQQPEIDHSYNILEDTFTGLGPYGALLSAFREHPDTAWLVAASDLPFLDRETLGYLVENRTANAVATAFESPHDGFPEPLIAIWEPKSYPLLLAFLAQGYSCPRKVLRNSKVRLLKAPDPEALSNVNTPGESARAISILNRKQILNDGS